MLLTEPEDDETDWAPLDDAGQPYRDPNVRPQDWRGLPDELACCIALAIERYGAGPEIVN